MSTPASDEGLFVIVLLLVGLYIQNCIGLTQ